MNLAEMLIGAMQKSKGCEDTPVKDVLDEAQAFVKCYSEKEEFKAGDLVVWKDGMKHYKIPGYGEPIVVLEVFPGQRKQDNGGQYGCEPSDMRCIVQRDSDGDFDVYAMDSHRFTKYNG
jgi:hypothetical protein